MDIVMTSAVALSAAIRSGEVSCAEVMGAFLDQIDRVNPRVNAIVALRRRDDLMAEARAADAARTSGQALGVLHGLPMAVKDLVPVKDIPYAQGSPFLRDLIPEEDGLMVRRLRAAGALIIGKTNTPEFGLGSHTYNPVYGATGNAYDQTRSAGGSSGGAAVALATRMLPLADGSDYGGSLRNPAGWNNVISLRPSLGRVPNEVKDAWLPTMSTLGPMGRSIPDLALLMGVQAGFDPRAPLSLETPADAYAGGWEADVKGRRIAWVGDFGGFVPHEPGVLDLCRGALKTFEDLGCTVEDAWPDYPLEPLWQAMLTLRAWQAGSNLLAYYQDPVRRTQMNAQSIFEVESGMKLSAYDITAASTIRTEWTQAVRRFFERYDYLVLPSAQVFPFPIEQDWPREVGGVAMQTYHEWMKAMFLVTLSGSPVLTVPAGFNAAGLPMGLQLVGPNRAERACLELGYVYDQATGWVERRLPPLIA